jgi:hypothetical protein
MPSRDLKDALPELVAAYERVKKVFEATCVGYQLLPICTYRSPAEQKIAFDAGTSDKDGTRNLSKHNHHPSRAMDVRIVRKNPKGMPASHIDDLLKAKKFDPVLHVSLYWNFGLLAQRNGLRWGGDWNDNGLPVIPDPNEKLNDVYHIELRGPA